MGPPPAKPGSATPPQAELRERGATSTTRRVTRQDISLLDFCTYIWSTNTSQVSQAPQSAPSGQDLPPHLASACQVTTDTPSGLRRGPPAVSSMCPIATEVTRCVSHSHVSRDPARTTTTRYYAQCHGAAPHSTPHAGRGSTHETHMRCSSWRQSVCVSAHALALVRTLLVIRCHAHFCSS